MAQSRLEKIGTIYSRITGLIRSGAMKLTDRPLWYDVYQAFPPKYEPRYDRPAPDITIKPIFYPEDVIRAKFYKTIKNSPSVYLNDSSRPSLCQKCIALTSKLQKEESIGLDEACDKAIQTILNELGAKFALKLESESNTSVPVSEISDNKIQA